MRVILNDTVGSPVTVVMYVLTVYPMNPPSAMLVTKYPHMRLRSCFSVTSATNERRKRGAKLENEQSNKCVPQSNALHLSLTDICKDCCVYDLSCWHQGKSDHLEVVDVGSEVIVPTRRKPSYHDTCGNTRYSNMEQEFATINVTCRTPLC